jgi:membrane associated rhomboid family serine protease
MLAIVRTRAATLRAPVIPIKDYNPTTRFAVVTAALIAINVLVYFGLQQRQGAQDQFSYERAAIPCELVKQRPLSLVEVELTRRGISDQACGVVAPAGIGNRPEFPHKQVDLAVLYSMFLHGGLLHIGGNMLFLWVFGNNIEDKMGSARYAIFYLVSGVVATLAHVAAQPDSTVPLIGASGAIAGVMGAYLVLFPRVRIRTVFIFFLILIRDVPAMWLLLAWFVLQFFTGNSSGVAWVAHVGGFAFGALVALIFRSRLQPGPPPAPPAWRGGY